MPIQDYLSRVHSRGHPLNKKHTVINSAHFDTKAALELLGTPLSGAVSLITHFI